MSMVSIPHRTCTLVTTFVEGYIHTWLDSRFGLKYKRNYIVMNFMTDYTMMRIQVCYVNRLVHQSLHDH